jgi:hypothetical protein
MHSQSLESILEISTVMKKLKRGASLEPADFLPLHTIGAVVLKHGSEVHTLVLNPEGIGTDRDGSLVEQRS